jgi:hypothetical protein
MPTSLPPRTRAQQRDKTERPRVLPRPRTQAVDWPAVWTLSLSAFGIGLAALVYFFLGESIGASFVLFSTAAIVAVIFFGNEEHDPDF